MINKMLTHSYRIFMLGTKIRNIKIRKIRIWSQRTAKETSDTCNEILNKPRCSATEATHLDIQRNLRPTPLNLTADVGKTIDKTIVTTIVKTIEKTIDNTIDNTIDKAIVKTTDKTIDKTIV